MLPRHLLPEHSTLPRHDTLARRHREIFLQQLEVPAITARPLQRARRSGGKGATRPQPLLQPVHCGRRVWESLGILRGDRAMAHRRL